MKQRNQWRTFSGVLALGFMMLVALWLCLPENRAAVAPGVVIALSTLGGYLAAKSYGEHRENARAGAVKNGP